MIVGTVSADEAWIELAVRGPRGPSRKIAAVIDTGFSSWLTLPAPLIKSLGLPWYSLGNAILADGSACEYDIFEATVLWDGDERTVFVDEADSEPLVGMKLMRGFELRIQVRPGGELKLKRLRR